MVWFGRKNESFTQKGKSLLIWGLNSITDLCQVYYEMLLKISYYSWRSDQQALAMRSRSEQVIQIKIKRQMEGMDVWRRNTFTKYVN